MQRLDFLTDLRAGGFPDAVVAGGFLRDFIHSREIKDIDVFLQWPSDFTTNPVPALDAAMGDRKRNTIVSPGISAYIEGMDPEVHAVFQYENGAYPIQVICLSEPFKLTRFDFGICQAFFDGDKVHYSGAFQADLKNKTFTLTRADSQAQFSRSMDRYERLHAKYPDHRLVIPPQFQQYVFTDAEEITFE